MGNGPPRVLLRDVQHDELMIFARNEESGLGNGAPIAQRGHFQILLLIIDGKDRERHGHDQLPAHEKLAEYGTHLLEPKHDLPPLFIAGVADDCEMLRAKLLPFRLSSWQR